MATAAGSHVWLLWKQGWFSSPPSPPLSLSLPSSPPHHPLFSFAPLGRQERAMGVPMHGTVWGNKLGPGPPPRLGRSHVGAPSRLARGHVCPFPGALPSMFPTLGCSFSGPGCGAQADFSASDKDPKESCLWQEWRAVLSPTWPRAQPPRHTSSTSELQKEPVSATAHTCKRKGRLLGEEIDSQRQRQRREGADQEVCLVCQSMVQRSCILFPTDM